YYRDRRLPEWVRKWNGERFADRYDGRTWNLLLDPAGYLAAGSDDRPWEEPPPGMGRTFPHALPRRSAGVGFIEAIAASPFGDEVLLDFTEELIDEEDIGDDEVVDYLSVSFSSFDYIGHRYGPSSLEMEDAILRVDDIIAKLIRDVEQAAGPGRTLVVLSSDHGVAESPRQLEAEGKDGGTVALSQFENAPGMVKVRKKFGSKLVRRWWPPYVYLDNDALRARALDPEKVARELAAEFAKAPGVHAAYTRGQIEAGPLPDTPDAKAVRRSFHSDRSGDIHVVSKPGWQLAYEGENPKRYTTGHGTPWEYDTHVPLIFAGPGVKRGQVSRRVETVDAAPTIAALLGIEPPSRATGRPLPEPLR
ncbi:MAG: alkaline phosphatase family protein, partial [Candidatus Binatia bacterium]